MPEILTIDDLNKLLEFGTLHGRIENWVFQTSHDGSQQIKFVTESSYTHNQINTALRTRARRIMAYAMRNHNPQTENNFSAILRDLYLSTIYLFHVPTAQIKADYLKIEKSGTYQIFLSGISEPIYNGPVQPGQYFKLDLPTTGTYQLFSYFKEKLIHFIQIMMVDEYFDIEKYFNEMFDLVNYRIPVFDFADGTVFIDTEVHIIWSSVNN